MPLSTKVMKLLKKSDSEDSTENPVASDLKHLKLIYVKELCKDIPRIDSHETRLIVKTSRHHEA